MTADRRIPNSTTPGAVTGDAFMDAVQEELTGLWNYSAIPLSNVAGTADAITADCVPGLTAGLIDGMTFWLTPALTTTSSTVTIEIDGVTAVPIKDSQGDALNVGALQAGLTRKLLYVGADNELRAIGTAESIRALAYQVFTASGTWVKPTGAPAGSWVRIEVWGGGGGGHTTGGGGGGAYNVIIKQLSDLGSTETVTVGLGGTGGAGATGGGVTSFGSHISAYGGGVDANGGGGGGAMSAGSGSTGGAPGGGDAVLPVVHSSAGGGLGGTPGPGDSDTGGGGGGGNNTNGGKSRYGGGGGGGPFAVGGASQFGGNGGNAGANGSAPGGGGGGAGGNGARGECRVWVIG